MPADWRLFCWTDFAFAASFMLMVYQESKSAALLLRVMELSLLLVIAATALAHPLCLPEDSLQALHDSFSNPKVFSHLLPWVSCGYSPLVLKEGLMVTLALFVFFIMTWTKVRGQWLGTEGSALNRESGVRGVMLQPEVWLGLFVLYGAASVFWSPTFQQSFRTAALLAAGSGLAMITGALPVGRQFCVRFMALVIGCGVILAGCALMQHLGIATWLPESSDPRNRMSSLIGHNTGLSSWLMFPLSFSFYFALTNRRLWLRGMAWLTAALIILVIIAAQSRAIWVLSLGLGVVVPWKIFRAMGLRLTAGKLAAAGVAMVLLVLALMIAPQKNPLARLPVSLGERITGHVFNLDQLRRETRLRILVVSVSELFPEAPLHGTGLGSFQWVYPEAQGRYFEKHPESRLGTTTKRTDLAHNDYLQVLVEMGLIGLLLLIATMSTVGLDLRKKYRVMRSPYDRAAWWALTVPVAGVALHALVDFPLHVVPIAVVALFSLQAARLLNNQHHPATTSAQAAFADDSMVTAEKDNRATLAGFAIAVVIFAWTPWAWHAAVGREIVSDAYFNSGQDWLQRYYDSRGQLIQRKFALLDRARRTFRQAVISNVFHGEAYEGQATAVVNRAALALQFMQNPPQDAGTTLTLAMRSIVERDSTHAVSIIQNQMNAGGLRYHFTWYLLGRAWRMQWELERGDVAPEDSRAYDQAVAALRKAVEYNPADASALRELSDILSQSAQTRPESQQLLTRLFKIDPWSARELIVTPAINLAAEGETATAHAMLEQVFTDYPDEPAVKLAKAWLAFYEAVWPPTALDELGRDAEYLQWRREHLGKGRDALEALPSDEDYGREKLKLGMLYAAAAGDLQTANDLAKSMLAKYPDAVEPRVILNWSTQELYGGGIPAERSAEYFQTSAEYAVYFMSRREQGLIWAGQTYGMGGRLTLAQARRLAAFCVANDLWHVMRQTLPVVREDYPGDPMLEEYARQTAIMLQDAATTSTP